MTNVIPLWPEVAGDQLDTRGYDRVPARTLALLNDYVFQHRSPGSFLTAVLSNDLHMAVILADQDNLAQLKPICQFIFNRVPNYCWGTMDAVELHLKSKP